MADVAPAPWSVALDAVVWFHRAAPGAADLAPVAGRTLPVTVGALIRYRDTPVGPYREVLGSPVLLAEWPLPAASIPFIAVDSEPSVRGGRENWDLPKTLAGFDWPEAPAAGGFEVDAEGDDWALHATVHTRPRRLPAAAVVRTRQAIGAFTTRVRGTARLGSIALETRGATLPRWLRSGRHPALVLEGVRGVVGPPS